jgi:hypothetical protein
MDVSPASGLVEGQAELPAAFLDDEGQGAAQQVGGAGRIGRRRFRSHTQILIAEKPSQCQNPSKGALWKNRGHRPRPQCHFVDHQTIVHNGMVVYDKINNAVRIMDEGRTANGSIPPQHTRVLDVTEAINDPKRNVIEPGLVNAISQSFLKDEVAKMYQGEIVLRFMPQLEPYDIIVVNDASTMMVGPIEVDTVMHEFSMEAGAVTVVKPRAVVTVNEYTSAEVIRGWTQTYAKAAAQVQSLLTTPESLGLGLGLFLAGQQHAPRAGAPRPDAPAAAARAGHGSQPCSRSRPEEELVGRDCGARPSGHRRPVPYA